MTRASGEGSLIAGVGMSCRLPRAADVTAYWGLLERLEDAGVAASALDGDPVGVFLGAIAGDYANLIERAGAKSGDPYTDAGLPRSIIALPPAMAPSTPSSPATRRLPTPSRLRGSRRPTDHGDGPQRPQRPLGGARGDDQRDRGIPGRRALSSHPCVCPPPLSTSQ